MVSEEYWLRALQVGVARKIYGVVSPAALICPRVENITKAQ
jgi:hypothetical protein